MVKFIYITDEMTLIPIETSVISIKQFKIIDNYSNDKTTHKKYDSHEINLSIDDIVDTEYHESSYYNVVIEAPTGKMYKIEKFYTYNDAFKFINSLIDSDETVYNI